MRPRIFIRGLVRPSVTLSSNLMKITDFKWIWHYCFENASLIRPFPSITSRIFMLRDFGRDLTRALIHSHHYEGLLRHGARQYSCLQVPVRFRGSAAFLRRRRCGAGDLLGACDNLALGNNRLLDIKRRVGRETGGWGNRHIRPNEGAIRPHVFGSVENLAKAALEESEAAGKHVSNGSRILDPSSKLRRVCFTRLLTVSYSLTCHMIWVYMYEIVYESISPFVRQTEMYNNRGFYFDPWANRVTPTDTFISYRPGWLKPGTSLRYSDAKGCFDGGAPPLPLFSLSELRSDSW